MASKEDKKRKAEALKVRTATKKYYAAIEGIPRKAKSSYDKRRLAEADKTFMKETNKYDSWRDKNPFDFPRRASQYKRSQRDLQSIRDGQKEFLLEGGERRRQRRANAVGQKVKQKSVQQKFRASEKSTKRANPKGQKRYK